MPQPDQPDLSSILVDRVRVTRLDRFKRILAGEDTSLVAAGLTTATLTPQMQAGTEITQVGGDGELAVNYQARDRTKGRCDGSFTLWQVNHQMRALALGGTTIEDVLGETTIGYDAPPGNLQPPVCLVELWSRAQQGTEPYIMPDSGLPGVFHFVLPDTVSTEGAKTLAGAVAENVFNFKGRVNPLIGHGPQGDWPIVPQGPYAVWLEAEDLMPDPGWEVVDADNGYPGP